MCRSCGECIGKRNFPDPAAHAGGRFHCQKGGKSRPLDNFSTKNPDGSFRSKIGLKEDWSASGPLATSLEKRCKNASIFLKHEKKSKRFLAFFKRFRSRQAWEGL